MTNRRPSPPPRRSGRAPRRPLRRGGFAPLEVVMTAAVMVPLAGTLVALAAKGCRTCYTLAATLMGLPF